MLINCDSKIIGKEIINECCEAFKNEQNEIIVSINLEPEKLDLSLIGYFISFKLTRPIIALCIKLNFDYNKSNNKDFNSFYFTLHQYRCHADMICGFNVFSIISLNNEPIKSTFENIVVSKSFLPIIPVNRNLYTRFFEEKLVNEAFEGELEFSSVSNYFNNIIKKPSIEKYELYISKIHSNEKNSTELKFNFDQSFDDLIHLHLLELLNNLFILENLNKPKLNRISILDKIKSKEYFTSICQLFLKEVLKHPKIYVLIFSLLIDKVHIAGIKNDNLEETLHKIKNLWNFCRSVLHGVNELVKNIIEHTEEGIGCLVFRFYSDKIWDEIIDLPIKNMPDFNQYRASIKTDINSFLQIDILDLGQLGIIPKLKKNIENKLLNFFSNKSVLKLLNNDLEILNQGYSLKDIIYPNIGPRKILLHQSKRSIAHFGLIIFGKLIQKNNGLFFVSSAKSLDERENYLYIGKNDINKSVFENNQNDNIVSNLLKEHSVKYGTNYKIVFPIITQKPKTSPHYTYSLERSTSLKSLKGIAQLLQFKNLRSSRNFEGIPIKNYLPVNFKTEKYLHKLLNIIIFEIEHSKEMPNIVMLDFNNINLDNESLFYRFIASLEENYPSITFVIHSFNVMYAEKLYNLCLLIHETTDLPFWNKESATILYPYIEVQNKSRFYYSDILWGEKFIDMFTINKIANNHFYNSIILNPEFFNYKPESNGDNKYDLTHLHCFYEKNLLPLDLIIKHNGNSIFEHNSRTLLNKSIINSHNETDKIDSYLDNFCNQSGFKIEDSHFKLGSKIHISDFYYAKRFFQNSFFSSRFAFLVSRQIIKNIGSIANNYNLLLLGYGEYSYLLLSQVCNFLTDWHKYVCNSMDFNYEGKIEYNILINPEKEEFINEKKLDKFFKVQVIVPIGSTFSTSLKIKNVFEQKYGENKIKYDFFSQDLNLIWIHDERSQKDNLTDTEKELNISISNSIENKIINVTTYDKKEITRDQKYFIDLSTKWYLPNKCLLCGFNDDKTFNIKNEKPLNFTDETSVTPQIIFDNPHPRKILSGFTNPEEIKFTYEQVLSGNIKNNSDNYSIFIDILKFFNDNEDNIVNWLTSFGNRIRIGTSSSNLIISPGHHSNTSFLHLVNNIIFNSSATILHLNPETENIQNFEKIYSELIKIHTHIYFVDDVISTGNSFLKINYYLKHINTQQDKKFECAFFLINRTSRYVNNNIERKIAGLYNSNHIKIISFFNLQLPALRKINNRSVLDEEKTRYLKLANTCNLTTNRIIFNKKAIKFEALIPRNIKVSNGEIKKVKRAYRYTIAMHAIIKNFEEDSNIINGDDFEIFLNNIKKSILELSCLDSSVKSIDHNEWDFAIMKAISHYPLKNHYHLRVLTFKYIEKVIAKLSDNTNSFKFYTSWISLMDSNFLLSKDYFNRVYTLLIKLGKDSTSKMDIIVYICSKILELIEREESRSFYLEEILGKLFDPNDKNYDFQQFVRFLIVENDKYLKKLMLFKENDSRYRYLQDFVKIERNECTYDIEKHLLPIQIIEESLCSNNTHGNEEFYSSLSVIEVLFSLKNCKTFFIVKYGESSETYGGQGIFSKNKPTLYCVRGTNTIINFDRFLESDFMYDLFQNQKTINEYRTIFEYTISGKFLTNMYNLNEKEQIPLDFEYLEGNRLLIIKISRIENNIIPNTENQKFVENVLGVYGFFYKAPDNKILNPFYTRLLLGLNNNLADYIERMFLNEAFKEKIDLENKRKFAFLTGHGRENLIKLATELNDQDFSRMLILMEHLQYIIYINNKINKDLPDESFKQFYKISNTNEIEREFFNKIKEYGDKILASQHIEYKVEGSCNINHPKTNLHFSFSKELLNLILIELIINAKKNRYINLEENKTDISITYKINSYNKLEIDVSNFGIKLSEEISNKFKNKENNIKGINDISSGIYMIRKLFKEFELGELLLIPNQSIGKERQKVKFTAKLILNPNIEK